MLTNSNNFISTKKNNRGNPYSVEHNRIILQLISEGYRWKDIALKLGRSSKSVSRHYHNKLKKEKKCEKTDTRIVNILQNKYKESKQYRFTITMDNNVLCSHILKYGNTLKKKNTLSWLFLW